MNKVLSMKGIGIWLAENQYVVLMMEKAPIEPSYTLSKDFEAPSPAILMTLG